MLGSPGPETLKDCKDILTKATETLLVSKSVLLLEGDLCSMHSVQFSSRRYLCAWKSPYMRSTLSLRCFPNRLPLKQPQCWSEWRWPSHPFKEDRIYSASSFHASHLQAIDGVVSLALCPQVVTQAPQHLKPLVRVALPVSLSARSVISLHSGMSRAVHPHYYISFQRWMSTIDTCESGLPIPLFTFCYKTELIESVRRMACVVCLSQYQFLRESWRAWVGLRPQVSIVEVETV